MDEGQTQPTSKTSLEPRCNPGLALEQVDQSMAKSCPNDEAVHP